MPNNRPVLIEVTVFGTYHMIDAKTPRNTALFAILKSEGGINATVPPGKYLFNSLPTPHGETISLEPA